MWIKTEKGDILNLKKAKCISITYSESYFVTAEYDKDWMIAFKIFESREEAQKYIDKLFFKICGSNNKKKGT